MQRAEGPFRFKRSLEHSHLLIMVLHIILGLGVVDLEQRGPSGKQTIN